MLLLDRETAIAAWRRAEARVYPSVMVNAALYEQYIGVVRAVAEELRDVRTEDALVEAWRERRDVVQTVVARSAPPMLALMDLDAVRDAAFCHRHREITREQGKELARARLERARRDGAEWVVLFEDVTPLGSQRLEMHVASGRAAARGRRAPARLGQADVHARGRAARPGRRRVAARQAAGDADADVRHPRGMGGAHRAGAQPVREALTVATHPKKIIDAHCHIGEIPPWKYYDLEHPVKPIVYDYPTTKDFVARHMDYFKVERALAISNYGVPIHELSFDLNDVVMDAATTNDRILAAIWVSFLPRNAELTRKALKLASESRVVALKTTFLLGGNPDPGSWDDETRALADECFDVCERHDLMFHFHTSPGGTSDINNFIPMVERYGKRCKIYLVHFGGGVSGHIKLVPKFLQWVRTATRSTPTRRGRSASARAGC